MRSVRAHRKPVPQVLAILSLMALWPTGTTAEESHARLLSTQAVADTATMTEAFPQIEKRLITLWPTGATAEESHAGLLSTQAVVDTATMTEAFPQVETRLITLWPTGVKAQEFHAGLLSTQTVADTAIAPASVSDRATTAEVSPQVETRQASTVITQGLLRGMYVTYAALQVLDARSTSRALDYGAREANPIMKSVASNRGVLMALKAGVAVSTIFVAEHVAKRNRVGAFILMAALNSVYATVVAHNYGVAREMASRHR